ncbi:MAG: DNA adenine methylase [Prevotella sp.]|uniref:DNA methyltransferase n=1 Tax=Prevotella sp. TaxID=59823 RepID=UPI002A299FED|nr:DNA methyltransferase [Prevotella sp.]MDD7317601.1 DNA adenine methylase [Prevotellaceae bacterium]MDY4020552.1 DNA adenine methylase [Prevotella sp.]
MKDPNWRKCILNADSRDVIKRIPDNSIDFILTDPPYNLGQHSTGNIPLPGRSAMNNDVAEWDMIDFNPEEWADEFIRILKPTGNLFIFTSYNQIGRWHSCLDNKFDTSNFMIWHKTNPAPKIFKAGFLNSCEMIFTCWNKKHTWNFISQKEMHNFIESPICMRPERISNPKHPAQKPISILKKMIEIASNKDDIIFDPFMGVGSTGVASLELDRRFIGVELDREYFDASKKRIDEIISNKAKVTNNSSYDIIKEEELAMVGEPTVAYQTKFTELYAFFDKKEKNTKLYNHIPTGLQPIIKWPGGKEKELKYILPNIPEFENYYEPFVGGGSVFMAVKANGYYINDLSEELVSLYKYISTSDRDFFKYARMIDRSWCNVLNFFKSNLTLIDTYIKYRNENISKENLKLIVHEFCKEKKADILNIIETEFCSYPCILLKEMEANLFRKMTRMKVLENEKHILPDRDVYDNIETAIKSSVYMNYRHMYNCKNIAKENKPLYIALFFFMRNYAYSGMFRYSSKGDFNVPYGGIAYNSKLLENKLNYYQSEPLLSHFATTHIHNLDFEMFLRETNPKENDFVFLDPPYDSEFSTYAQNNFTKEDQGRLADYMLNECKAKWMMIIKYTDFIYSLYNKNGIKIRTFDKEYLVSFMNRNNKRATHLLITNY